MVSWALVFAKQALKDAKKMASTGLKPKVQDLLAILAAHPLPFSDLNFEKVYIQCTHD